MFNNIKKNELSIMKETIKVKLRGGFHNSKSITLSIGFKVESLISYADGQTSLTELIDENLSSYQRKRLENHFCGIKGCTCGSWLRANVDDDSIKDIKGMVETIRWLKNRRPSTIYEKCDMLGGEHGQYEIKDPKEFAERYMKENGYTRYEIITCGKFSRLPFVYFSNDERAIGFFKD